MGEPCDGPEVSDRLLLMAFVALTSADLAAALNALADDRAISRRFAVAAQRQADTASWSWALEFGAHSDKDPLDRLVEVRTFTDEWADEMSDMLERLALI